MTTTGTQIEELAAWCEAAPELNGARAEARTTFFGSVVGSPIDYWAGTGDVRSRERRFLGWFMFSHRLPDGRQPAEVAAEREYRGADLMQLLEAVRNTRFVTASVTSITPGRGALLEIEDERLDVRSRTWAKILRPKGVMMAHLLPVRAGTWMPGPGWLVWPIELGPGVRGEMKRVFQPTPIEVERILQGKTRSPRERLALHEDDDIPLAEAVARMTEAAEQAGRSRLALSVEAWEQLVVRHLHDADSSAFAREIVDRAGHVEKIEELQQWLDLARLIWNAIPQPDRDGKTANELSRQRRP